jgi:hypothetical protein
MIKTVSVNQIIIYLDVDKYLKLLKTQIREGTSILYDLQPLFLSLNLGQCGLQLSDMRSHLLKEYHLLRRRGALIKDEEFVVSVLRHLKDPLSFKIIASSTEMGEEFILDLAARDLIELTEGRTHLLEASEPSELIDCIIDNLNICLRPHRALQCEH